MSSKRKREQIEDSDSDEPTLGKQVLPVANLPADFAGEPEDGLQYLFMVRRDARTLPHTTRVPNPYELKEEPHESPDIMQQGSSDKLPTEEWRETFLYRFKNFRQNCTQPTVHVDTPSRPTHKIMPDRKEREHWWAFLNGCPESEWNPPKKPKKQNNRNERYGDHTGRGMRGFSDESGMYGKSSARTSHTGMRSIEEITLTYAVSMDPTDSLPTPFGTPVPPDRTSGEKPPADKHEPPVSIGTFTVPCPPEPTPSLMREIDHRYAVHLLMYFAHWINLHLEDDTPQKYVVTETHARWMFVLLARVDEYISADEASTLRSLARGCIGLVKLRMEERAAASPTTEGAAEGERTTRSGGVIAESSCWMIIAAVIGVWAQRDLWQDAEAMLAQVAA